MTTTMQRPDLHERSGIGDVTAPVGEQVSRLVREELRLAQLAAPGVLAGLGIGLLAAAILVACGAGALVAAAILALAVVVDAWLAALIVSVVLFSYAGLLAVFGRQSQAALGACAHRRAAGRR